MNVRKLQELLDRLPAEYLDRPVYYCTEFKNDYIKNSFDPESLTDINEFTVDLDDNVIILRGTLGW